MSLIPHSPDGHGSVVLSEAVAKARGLSVIQLPKPGSIVDGSTVNDKTPAKVAIKPLVDALVGRIFPQY